MRLSRLKRVEFHEFKNFITSELQLNASQKEDLQRVWWKMPFSIYKDKGFKKYPWWWRLTIILYLPYCFFMILGLPFNYVINGKWGYDDKFLRKFHYPWVEKLNL